MTPRLPHPVRAPSQIRTKGGILWIRVHFPTKGESHACQKISLTLAKQGYELMDKKRNILIRELMDLIDEARDIQDEIDSTFTYAYQCLQRANIEHGINMVSQIAYTVPIENSITIQTRSIMGTEIPHVKYTPSVPAPTYAFSTTRESADLAADAFRKVKDLTVKLSMVENAAYRLATNIKKTQKRQMRCKISPFQCIRNWFTISPMHWKKKNGKNSHD